MLSSTFPFRTVQFIIYHPNERVHHAVLVKPLPTKLWRELWLGPAVMFLPWLYVVFAWWHGRRMKDKG